MATKTALITGGARGIGHAIALSLAKQGWSVAICYRTSAERAHQTVQEIEQCGSDGFAEAADVSDPRQAQDLARAVETRWGRIDALINCAGPFRRVPILEETADGWLSMFANNLHPVFYLSKAVAPGMTSRKSGRIINFSVANADQCRGLPNVTGYAIAKLGCQVLTRALATALAPSGITVNAISPGFIDSEAPMGAESQAAPERIPAGYIGTTDDVVGVVEFLLSEAARYVNGANIHVSGAWGV